MIFISGVHGVGKSFFCDMVQKELNINTFSASNLIATRKQAPFSADRLIPDIGVNQQYLLAAVTELCEREHQFLLDGHFCLLNGEGKVTRISVDTFISLKPNPIILLTEDPTIIAERRNARDGLSYSKEEIQSFQDEEITYSKEVAVLLGVELKISKGAADLDSTIAFIKNQ